MRLHEAINIADEARPNNVPLPSKINCIYKLERELAEMAEADPPVWDLNEDDPELLVKEPHSSIYWMHLLPFIDLQQEEMDLYQVDAIAANQELSELKAMYRRNTMPTARYIKGVFI